MWWVVLVEATGSERTTNARSVGRWSVARAMSKLNENPTVYAVSAQSRRHYALDELSGLADESSVEPFDSQEVFELIRDIQDPEHPLTLEQLNVLECTNIHINNETSRVEIFFTPTVPHCSMSVSPGFCPWCKWNHNFCCCLTYLFVA